MIFEHKPRGVGTQGEDRHHGGSRAARIARLAYEKWQARGCPAGDDRRDWFDAEKEIATSSDGTIDLAGAPPQGGRAPR
jgi:hypothetical protein